MRNSYTRLRPKDASTSPSHFHFLNSFLVDTLTRSELYNTGATLTACERQPVRHRPRLLCSLNFTMSSPTPADTTTNDATRNPEIDVDIDAEMTDTQTLSVPNANGASSSNIDPEYPPQQDNQPSTTAAHHNRKDATLREFLSKMDDYAPIVRSSTHAHYYMC